MDDTTAASVGFVLAGVALAASLSGWRQDGQLVALAAVTLAAVALAAFALRRYGRLDRSIGPVLAAVASIGIVAAAFYAAVLGGDRLGAVVATLAAGGSAVFAYADWRGIDRASLARKAGATVVGTSIGVAGIVAIILWSYVFGAFAAVSTPSVLEDAAGRTILSTIATGAGTVTVVALYLRFGDRDLTFLDVRTPDLRGVIYAVVGTLAIFAGNLAIGLAFQEVGVETAQHTIIRTAESDPTILLALVPLSYLVIAPGEELLFRNVVQKRLRTVFSPVAGIVVASAVFAAVHFSAYLSPDSGLLPTLNTLAIIFVLALVLGAVYERTGNVVVSMLAHGTFNAIAFAVTYAQLTGALGG